jgi:hypothetical protein
VRVVADRGLLTDLVLTCGAAEVVELVTSGRLEITYVPTSAGIYTENAGTTNERHKAIVVTVPSRWAMQHAVPAAFQEAVSKPGRSRRLAAKVQPYLQEYSFDDTLTEAAESDFLDPAYLSGAAEIVLRQLAPEYRQPEPFLFEAFRDGNLLTVKTNVDFIDANRSHRKHFPVEVSTLGPSGVLSQVLNALGELQLSAIYTSDLATDPNTEALIRHKCGTLLQGRDQRSAAIETFQSLTVTECPTLREVINSGERNFTEFIDLLEKADRFRDWLEAQEPTADLVAQYVRSATEKTWIEKLPAKLARWSVATGTGLALGGAGTVGIAVTAGLGAIDTFVLDRFLAGWQPSQFVDDQLKSFLDQQ